jgi:hypothetical protein
VNKKRDLLSSAYVKKANAPLRAPRFTNLMTSTHNFISLVNGLAEGSKSIVRSMRVSKDTFKGVSKCNLSLGLQIPM